MQRKKPFSGKQKKEQLQAKKQRKRQQESSNSDSDFSEPFQRHVSKDKHDHKNTIKEACIEEESVFAKLSQETVEMRKIESREPLKYVKNTFISLSDLYSPDSLIQFPIRPDWTCKDSKQTLEKRETDYFENWKQGVYDSYPVQDLSYFEHNLQVWRQLWRVVEISDIILLVFINGFHGILGIGFTSSCFTFSSYIVFVYCGKDEEEIGIGV
jgi:hypothetical protein